MSRPLSTPCALPYRNGQQNVSVAPLLDDGQRDKSVIRNILNLLVARGPEQILKVSFAKFRFDTMKHCNRLDNNNTQQLAKTNLSSS